jgi:hypothetical protein
MKKYDRQITTINFLLKIISSKLVKFSKENETNQNFEALTRIIEKLTEINSFLK